MARETSRGDAVGKRVAIAVVALTVAATLSGAAAGKSGKQEKGAKAKRALVADRVFLIKFDARGCLDTAFVQDGKRTACPGPLADLPDCTRAKNNETVAFVTVDDKLNPNLTDFQLEFDPFASKPIYSSQGAVEATIKHHPGPQDKSPKQYSFDVVLKKPLKPGCNKDRLDPQIILD